MLVLDREAVDDLGLRPPECRPPWRPAWPAPCSWRAPKRARRNACRECSRYSRMPWIVPSSPNGPCSALKATSGFSLREHRADVARDVDAGDLVACLLRARRRRRFRRTATPAARKKTLPAIRPRAFSSCPRHSPRDQGFSSCSPNTRDPQPPEAHAPRCLSRRMRSTTQIRKRLRAKNQRFDSLARPDCWRASNKISDYGILDSLGRIRTSAARPWGLNPRFMLSPHPISTSPLVGFSQNVRHQRARAGVAMGILKWAALGVVSIALAGVHGGYASFAVG